MDSRIAEYLARHDNWRICVTMPDGSKWSVPVMVIAVNRAQHFAHEFGDGAAALEKSLWDETIPTFEKDEGEIFAWASGNMDWADVCDYAKLESSPARTDYQEGWLNGEKTILGKRSD
jgi:hypothetical protein